MVRWMLASKFGVHDLPAAQHLPKASVQLGVKERRRRARAMQVEGLGTGACMLIGDKERWLLSTMLPAPLSVPRGAGGEVDFPTAGYPLQPARCLVVQPALLLNQSAES